MEVIDPKSVVVHWKRPYIDADQLFGYGTSVSTVPLPAHLLAPTYTEDKASFTLQSYWADDFVGAGPFGSAPTAGATSSSMPTKAMCSGAL